MVVLIPYLNKFWQDCILPQRLYTSRILKSHHIISIVMNRFSRLKCKISANTLFSLFCV